MEQSSVVAGKAENSIDLQIATVKTVRNHGDPEHSTRDLFYSAGNLFICIRILNTFSSTIHFGGDNDGNAPTLLYYNNNNSL